jgi:hypothetical protein
LFVFNNLHAGVDHKVAIGELECTVDAPERGPEILMSAVVPGVVEDYRVAYRVSKESAEGRATTEDLREAMVRYRSLFAGLLDVHDEASHETTERRPR